MPKTRLFTPAEDRTWRHYRRMRTLLDLAISRDLRENAGVSEADYDVLSALAEADGGRCRARALAAQLLWSSSRLAHQVGRMETRGLVGRGTVEDDARGAVVALTALGRRTLRTARPQHVASVRAHLFGRLSAAELRTLGRLADRVAVALDS